MIEQQLFQIARAFNIEPNWRCDICWGGHSLMLLKTQRIWVIFYADTEQLRNLKLSDGVKQPSCFSSLSLELDPPRVTDSSKSAMLIPLMAEGIARLGRFDALEFLECEYGPLLTAHQRIEAFCFAREMDEATMAAQRR